MSGHSLGTYLNECLNEWQLGTLFVELETARPFWVMRLKIAASCGRLGSNLQHFELGFDIEIGSLLKWCSGHLSGWGLP